MFIRGQVTHVQGTELSMLGHNHPSGNPKPSTEDLDMTTTLLAAAKAIGLPLLDHIVVARNGKHCSISRMLVLRRQRADTRILFPTSLGNVWCRRKEKTPPSQTFSRVP